MLCQSLGWLAFSPNTTATADLNAAGSWLAYSFIPTASKTLNAARSFVFSKTGTLASGDITCSLYSAGGTSNGPNSAIESGKTPTSTITASGWYNFTGFTTALTAGTQYWLVFKNGNATPASNFCTFRHVASPGPTATYGSGVAHSWGAATTTNSGASWSLVGNRTNMRVAYSDGTYDGLPVSNAAAAQSADGVYATRESGVKFTTPANGVLNVAGVAMYVVAPSGTPTNAAKFGLWSGSTPSNLAYTNTIPLANFTTTQWIFGYFASVQTIQPGTILRATLATSGSDTSSNRYNNQEITWDTDSASLALQPWGGCVKTYYDGSSWTDTSSSLFAHALLLDFGNEFGAGAGGVAMPVSGRIVA